MYDINTNYIVIFIWEIFSKNIVILISSVIDEVILFINIVLLCLL